MLASLALIALAPQVSTVLKVPAGTRSEIQAIVRDIQAATGKADWKRATALAKMLPGGKLTVEVDEKTIPAANRVEFLGSITKAIESWTSATDTEIQTVPKQGDLKISFNSVLPKRTGTDFPAGVALLWNRDPGPGRVEAVFGLKRGNPLQKSEPQDIINDSLFAIGSALGHDEVGFGNGCMVRRDLPAPGRLFALPFEAALIEQVRDFSDSIRTLVAQKKPVVVPMPALVTDTEEFRVTGAVQGDKVEFSLQLSNQGRGDLIFKLAPDCGCVFPEPRTGTVAAGSTYIAKVVVDTKDYPGSIFKRVMLTTNDPTQPTRVIPIYVQSEPLYRILGPAGLNFAVDERPTMQVYVAVSPNNPMRVLMGKTVGIEGKVEIAPWKGQMADPELGEGPMAREGYRVSVTLDPKAPLIGRSTIGLELRTDDPVFPVIKTVLGAQKGIVALPERIFWGEIGTSPKRTTILVSRPGKRFQIRKVSSNSAHIGVQAQIGKVLSEHVLTVTYSGKAPDGIFRATIKIETDDPKQGTILVPVEATVR